MRSWLALILALLIFAYAAINGAALQQTAIESWFVLALMTASALTLTMSSRRPATSITIAAGLFLALHLAAVAKFEQLRDPLLVTDLLYFSNFGIVETLKQYPQIVSDGVYFVVGLIVLLWLLNHADFRLYRNRSRPARSALQLTGCACGLLLLAWLDSARGPYAEVVNKSLWNSLSDTSHLTNFFVSIPNSSLEMPQFEGTPDTPDSWPLPESASSKPATRPDLFVVLEESTFDPRSLPLCKVDVCNLPEFFDPDRRTVTSGPLLVHTFGGATYTSEFASLTGLPHTLFGAAGHYAPYKLAPLMHRTLPQHLSELGYRSVAIYPMYGNFLNARTAYLNYGFDAFHDADELQLGWSSHDSDVFEAMSRVLVDERKHGKPLFVYILTLYQHGPHSHDLAKLQPPWRNGVLPDQPPALNTAMTNYLYRLHDSAQAMHALEQQLLDRPDPTVLLHFGDHQPSFDGLLMPLPRLQLTDGPPAYAITYFMLKSNLAGASITRTPLLDIAYLPGLLLQAAGLPTGRHFGAQVQLRERCAGRFDDCADRGLLRHYYDHLFNHLKVMQAR